MPLRLAAQVCYASAAATLPVPYCALPTLPLLLGASPRFACASSRHAMTCLALPLLCLLQTAFAVRRAASPAPRQSLRCRRLAGLSCALPVPHADWLRFAITVLRCPTLCHRLAKPRHALPTLRSTLPRNACAVRRLGWQCRCVSLPLLCVALRSPACASHLIALPCLSQAVLNHALPWPCRAAP
jgi:hypothetical protein